MRYFLGVLIVVIMSGSVGTVPNSASAMTTISAAPVLRSVTGPAQRQTYQAGSWTVVTSALPANTRYMVWWGDEYGEKPSMSGVLVRTATAFTHTYEYPGTYTITVRLMLANGTMSERYTTVVVREPDMTPYTQSYTPTYVSTPYYVPQYTTQTYYAPTPTATYATYPTYESNYYTHHYWYSDGHDEEDTEDGGAPYYYQNTYVKPATIYTEPPATWSSWWYGE